MHIGKIRDILKIPTILGAGIISWKRFLDGQFVKRLLIVGGSIAGVYLLLAVVVTVVLVAREDSVRPPSLAEGSQIVVNFVGNNDEELDFVEPLVEEDDSGFLRPPARTNFMFVGLDNNLLADAIMVGTFYRDSGDIRLMSIPRDMYTVIPEHRLTQMRADGLRPPTRLKINEMRSFGGRTHGIYYLKDQLGEMLGVQFNYYVEVELAAFRRIVDAIGGVEMYIPQRLFYEDPYQNLFINVPAGMQRLDGRMAEGVVRFRSFPTGDLMRNQMQMEFMNQLIRQTLTREAIMNNPLEMINIVLNDVATNVGMEMVRYLPYLPNVTADGISTFTLPGHGARRHGLSFFIPDAANLSYVVNQVFYYFPGENGTNDDEPTDDYEYDYEDETESAA